MKNSINDSELIDLATKKLAGEAGPEDLARLEELVSQNEVSRKIYEELVRTWEGTEAAAGFTADETNEEWMRLRDAIRKESSVKKSFSFMKIAASLVFIVAAGLTVLMLTQDDQVQVTAVAIQNEILSDGSSITLNAQAELSYPEAFEGETREVNLQGEAFFDIAKNPEKPFIIHTSRLDIRVTGTSFTVRAVTGEETVEVVVATGSVEINHNNKTVSLEAGEKGILDINSGSLFKIVNDDQNFMAWKTKIFTFDDLPLEQVIDVLNNAYRRSLYLRGEQIAKCPVTVSFNNQSVESIMEVLKATLDLTVTETDKGIEISGEGC